MQSHHSLWQWLWFDNCKSLQDFPEESIAPTLKQISENLKGSRSGREVVIRLRGLDYVIGATKPIILGEIKKSFVVK